MCTVLKQKTTFLHPEHLSSTAQTIGWKEDPDFMMIKYPTACPHWPSQGRELVARPSFCPGGDGQQASCHYISSYYVKAAKSH